MTMTDAPYTRLIIRDLRLDAFVGVFAAEEGGTQPVVVNLSATVMPPAGRLADDYTQVVWYARLAQGIRDIAARGHIRLVETFAEKIALLALEDARVFDVRVRVEKTAILPDAAAVGVEIMRRRETPVPASRA